MKEYTEYDLSRLLKHKGFDLETVHYWFDGGTVSVPTRRGDGLLYNWNAYASHLRISAPSYTQAINWFLNRHGIWITVYPLGVGYYCYQLYTVKKRDDPKEKIVQLEKDSVAYDELFDTPQEAYSAAFDYILNHLI